MRAVEIAPEVAELLGPDLTARLNSENWNQTVQCWDCGQLLPPSDPAVVLVIWPVDFGAGGLQHAVHAHPGCSRSEVRRMTVAELDARPRRTAETGPDADVDVVATVWDHGDGSGYAAVLISFRDEIQLEVGGERVDGAVAGLSAAGWQPTRDLSVPPAARPPGWRLRCTITDVQAGHGVLELINAAGQVETVATIYDSLAWMAGAHQAREAVVVMGSRYLADWITEGHQGAAEQAARGGRVVAGVVPVQLLRATG
jgi:hypothetical protein